MWEVLNNSSISVKHLMILHDKQKCHKTEDFFLVKTAYINEKTCSPMPTCASRIMLTSLAPSPIAKVMGCSLEALISFTICQNKQTKSIQHHQHGAGRVCQWRALRSPELSAVAPSDSRARRCSCGRSLEKCLCSCPARRPPGWALAQQTAWPRRWSDRNPNSPLTTWTKPRMSDQQEAAHTGRRATDGTSLEISDTQRWSAVWSRSCSVQKAHRADSAPLSVSWSTRGSGCCGGTVCWRSR